MQRDMVHFNEEFVVIAIVIGVLNMMEAKVMAYV